MPLPIEAMTLDQLLCERGISCYDKDLERENSSTLLLLAALYFMSSMYIIFDIGMLEMKETRQVKCICNSRHINRYGIMHVKMFLGTYDNA